MTMHRFKITKANETFERFVTTEDPEHVANFWRVVGFQVEHAVVDVIVTEGLKKHLPAVGETVEVWYDGDRSGATHVWLRERVNQRIIEGDPAAFATTDSSVLFDRDEGVRWRWPAAASGSGSAERENPFFVGYRRAASDVPGGSE